MHRTRYHFLEETTSTNDEARNPRYGHGDAICAERQTAGRGQRGHTWSSEEGRNLMFSLVWEPRFLPVSEQFLLSEAVALALTDLFGGYGIDARIKWTNDIYAGDRKLSITTKPSGNRWRPTRWSSCIPRDGKASTRASCSTTSPPTNRSSPSAIPTTSSPTCWRRRARVSPRTKRTTKQVKRMLLRCYSIWKNKEVLPRDWDKIRQYSRKNQVGRLLKYLAGQEALKQH